MTKAQKENQERFKKVQAEAKKLKAKNPKLKHVDAVKKAWAILYNTGKVGAVKTVKTAVKKKASIAGVFKFAGYQFEDARQFDIYGNLSYVISNDNGAMLFVIDGNSANIAKYSDLLAAYIRKEKGLTDKEISLYKTNIKKFITQLTKEIQEYNKGKKSSAKPAKSFVPAAAAKAPAKKKVAAKKYILLQKKKASVKKQTGTTNIAIDKKIQAQAPGKRISKDGNVYYESRENRSDKGRLLGIKKPAVSKHKDTNSHNVNIKIMSGINSKAINQYQDAVKGLEQWNKILSDLDKAKNHYSLTELDKKLVRMDITRVKNAIKEQKQHIKELKKLI